MYHKRDIKKGIKKSMKKVEPRNRIRCLKCKDVIESKDTHDFVTCECGAVSADGGQDYYRRVGSLSDYEEVLECPND